MPIYIYRNFFFFLTFTGNYANTEEKTDYRLGIRSAKWIRKESSKGNLRMGGQLMAAEFVKIDVQEECLKNKNVANFY